MILEEKLSLESDCWYLETPSSSQYSFLGIDSLKREDLTIKLSKDLVNESFREVISKNVGLAFSILACIHIYSGNSKSVIFSVDSKFITPTSLSYPTSLQHRPTTGKDLLNPRERGWWMKEGGDKWIQQFWLLALVRDQTRQKSIHEAILLNRVLRNIHLSCVRHIQTLTPDDSKVLTSSGIEIYPCIVLRKLELNFVCLFRDSSLFRCSWLLSF